MKPFILIMAFMFGLQCILQAQKSNPKKSQPKEDIHVNREFDQNGNMIKFDSVYSYSWSGDTLLLDSIHPKNFPFPFGNNFNFPSDSSFFDRPFLKDFDQHAFAPLTPQQDSIMNQFLLHQPFNFNNDSIDTNSFDLNDFFKQFSENKNDSISINTPFNDQFNFSPNSMNDMMKIIEEQMKEMEKQRQKYFNK